MVNSNNILNGNNKIPRMRKPKMTLGQKLADLTSRYAGSWLFIGFFLLFLIFWTSLNTILIMFGVWDPYPFILLNLFLSCLAAIQAPIILMSQNRQSELDRRRAQYDYYVDRQAEREIKQLQIDVLDIKEAVLKQSTKKQTRNLRNEVKKIQDELNKIQKK